MDNNKESCSQLIKPSTIQNCDFEADVSGEFHIPFLCVLQA